MKNKRCPICHEGYLVEDDLSPLLYESLVDKVIEQCCGYCSNCKREFEWGKLYIFDSIIDVVEV